jgi:hypothetical protein
MQYVHMPREHCFHYLSKSNAPRCCTASQGDQIGRIFTYGVTFYFELFCENYRSGQVFWLLFSTVKVIYSFWQKKLVGLHFGRFYSKTHLRTLSEPDRRGFEFYGRSVTPFHLFFNHWSQIAAQTQAQKHGTVPPVSFSYNLPIRPL